MFKRPQLACFYLLSLLAPAAIVAEPIGVGSTRDEVVAQLGDPKSKMRAGGREILGYPNGRVTLAEDRVVSVDWKGRMPVLPSAPAQPSAPAAPVVSNSTARGASPAPREIWLTDFTAAQAEAAASKRQLLVLFTGSDWCPACIHFEANVAHAENFLKATQPSFVLVKLDYPRNTPQAPALRARNDKLLRQYGVDSFPTLMVIAPDGAKVDRVDSGRSRPARDIVDYFVQAVAEVSPGQKKSSFWSR